ncbi:hypothetical protein VNI00_002950 [Paramarasmius palmivorus]|uniref:Major facilitator superfamily (MFS) profile domain-containing protein n=1 Tax=Paramarasmius palmivorus TaxID=297713 RepID=A0AAW0DZM8_9AGAR
MEHSQQSIELEVLPHRSELVARVESHKSGLEPVEGATSHSQSEETAPPKSRAQVWKGRLQLASLFWALFLAGWNDATTGPLLPRYQEVYKVNDTIVSLIFIFACVGFVAGAAINIPLSTKYSFGTLITAGALLQVVGYTLQSTGLPFPAFILAYAINGVGIAIQDAQANGFVAAIKENAETKMGILHAIYGVGALCAPLVATQFAQMDCWSFHFLFSLGFAVINVIGLVLVFRFKSQDDCLGEIGQAVGEKSTSEHSNFRQILGQKNVHLMAFFILVYVGVEVTIGGWIVTFIIRERQGGPSSGYISSGFFGGLAAGRVALLWLNALVGERNVMFIYASLAIGLELVVWLVPSLVGGGIAISIVGFLLGPMYPITMNHAGRILPRWVLTGAIGWIAGFGQAGSAVLPFITGALAGKYGISSLQPFLDDIVNLSETYDVIALLVQYSHYDEHKELTPQGLDVILALGTAADKYGNYFAGLAVREAINYVAKQSPQNALRVLPYKVTHSDFRDMDEIVSSTMHLELSYALKVLRPYPEVFYIYALYKDKWTKSYLDWTTKVDSLEKELKNVRAPEGKVAIVMHMLGTLKSPSNSLSVIDEVEKIASPFYRGERHSANLRRCLGGFPKWVDLTSVVD